jgi:hypothetical protein
MNINQGQTEKEIGKKIANKQQIGTGQMNYRNVELKTRFHLNPWMGGPIFGGHQG